MTTTTDTTPDTCGFCGVEPESIRPPHPAGLNVVSDETIGEMHLCAVCFDRRDAIFMSLLSADEDVDNRALRAASREQWRAMQDDVRFEGDD